MVVRVVVVDDVPSIRDLLQVNCDVSDHLDIVGAARDGHEAVALAERLQPDVIVLDNALPDLDGIDAIPLIRAVAPRARVVMFSGMDGVAELALAAGADAFLAKCRPLDELLALLGERPAVA
ncbi:MAG: response regulator [Egibacteraceae bacterium]